MKFFVNTRPVYWSRKAIHYSELLILEGHNSDGVFTIQYSRGPSDNIHGTMIDGQIVKVTEGMVFDVTNTNNA